MSQYPIAVIVGSLRRDSLNRKLATALSKLAPKEFSFKQVEIGDLPLYNQDDDAKPAEAVKRLKNEIAAARGLLFVTPEYNRSIPGVLKNALEPRLAPLWRERMGGQARRRHRCVDWRRRHRDGAAALAQYTGVFGRTHARST